MKTFKNRFAVYNDRDYFKRWNICLMKSVMLYSFLVLFCITNNISAQLPSANMGNSSNFYAIQKSYNDYFMQAKRDDAQINIADDEETKFRRWEWFMEPRVFPSGKIPAPNVLLNELIKYKATHPQYKTDSLSGDWISLEPPSGFPAGGYSGRLNCIAFHPLDSNVMYAGSPAGGLWKTTDGGLTWAPKTDFLPSIGVSEIVINAQDPSMVYMATGDKDGASFISNPYSYGLLKSTDGGNSWDTTGLQFILADQMTIQRLLIHPLYPNMLFAAVSGVNGNYRGIWKSVDDGINWTNVHGGAKYDIEFNPGNPSIMYASGYGYTLMSNDTGSTWTTISSPVLPTSGVTSSKIAVTPAQPDIVYVQYLNPSTGSTYGLYKSSDAGDTWVQKNSEVISLQGGYDWVLTASPVDSDLVFYGGQYLYKSLDAGTTTNWLSAGHVDHHGLDFRPGSNVLYNCDDGGLYKSYNNGASWINLNHGFQTFQYYRLGCSVTNPGFILTGAQDNGTWRHNNGNWNMIGWSDGMECIIDYSDTNIYYIASQYGYITRFGGSGFFTQPPTAGNNATCAWTTPYIINPANPQILYYGAKDIYKTNNRGNSWTNYSTNLTDSDNVGGGMIRSMAVCDSMPENVLYAASYVVVYKTINGGAIWLNITSNLPVSAGCFNCSAISGMAVHPTNPDIVWVTMSGFAEGNKVFKTVDGGISWTNISGTLPNLPVNCIVYQKNSKDALYIGTDVGVYYRDSSMMDWVPYMTNLPNVPVSELEIHYGTGKIRAATFGRGLWESDLYNINTSINNNDWGNSNRYLMISPNPSNGRFDYRLILDEPVAIKVELVNMLGHIVFTRNENSISGQYSDRINISDQSKGIYILKVQAGSHVFQNKIIKH